MLYCASPCLQIGLHVEIIYAIKKVSMKESMDESTAGCNLWVPLKGTQDQEAGAS